MQTNPRLLTSESGLSMISVLVGFSMMSVLMAMLADAAVMSGKVQRNSNIQTEFNAFSDSIRLVLAHEAQCTPALKGAAYASPLSVKDPLDTSRVLGAPGDHHLTGWTITRLEIQEVKSIPGSNNLLYGKLFLEASKEMTHAVGAPFMARTISDVYFEASAGMITRCYGSESWLTTAEGNCKMLGGSWNAEGALCTLKTEVKKEEEKEVVKEEKEDLTKTPAPTQQAGEAPSKEKGDHNNDGHLDNGKGNSNGDDHESDKKSDDDHDCDSSSSWGNSVMKIGNH